MDDVDGVTLLDQALNGRLPKVTVPNPNNPERRVVDRAKTLAAREMQDKIKREFSRWAWPDRGGRSAWRASTTTALIAPGCASTTAHT